MPDTPRPFGRTYTRAEIEAIEAQVHAVDPLLVEAADDQDIAMIRWHLSLDPIERLRGAWGMAEALGRFRVVGSGR
ncbi:MAG: hypothetical protein H6739_19395 [Alphaproteobacteria bacterium]|nr:hypothetical protein [Alphaproteobacteria bacterium]